jgi:hypothetical protein
MRECHGKKSLMKIPPRGIPICGLAVVMALVLSGCGENDRKPGARKGETPASASSDSNQKTIPQKAAKSSGPKGIAIHAAAQSMQPYAYPLDAYLLPVSQKQNLQSALDTYKVVRLEAGDYASGGLPSITLNSGCKLYGFPSITTIPPVTVAPGSSNVVLTAISVASWGAVTFPASSAITRHCLLMRILDSGINISGATLEDNLFLDLSNSQTVNIDTSAGGHLRNNRFVRTMVHGNSPCLNMHGDNERQSYGNVFLWFTAQTPVGDSLYIDNQKDVTLAVMDGEQWDINHQGTKALITTGPMGVLRAIDMEGGTPPNGKRTGVYDIAADEFQLYTCAITSDTALSSNLVHRRANQRSLLENIIYPKSTVDQASRAFRVQTSIGEESGANTFRVNGAKYTGALPSAQQTTLRNMVVNPARDGVPWERPVFTAIPDPGGPNWKAGLASKKDSTAYLQSLIEKNGVAMVPAGTYYISRPLELKNEQGLAGAGADKTLIVAKNPNMDMIVGNEHDRDGSISHWVVTDLTLQGGKNGIHQDPNGSGAAQLYNLNNFSHVTFRNMSAAGICFDKICGWDNGFIDNVNFVACGTGFQQITDPTWNGQDGPGEAYMDKIVFYECQFVNCGVGLSLPAWRENHLNAWIHCLFSGCTTAAARMANNEGTCFANCDFINNAGDPSVDQNTGPRHTVHFLNCHFRADALGQVMLGAYTMCDGCTFDRGSSTTATILGDTRNWNHFNNCISLDMPMGGLKDGTLLNNHFALDPDLDQQGVIVQGGAATTILPGKPAPTPQILFGSKFPTLSGK